MNNRLIQCLMERISNNTTSREIENSSSVQISMSIFQFTCYSHRSQVDTPAVGRCSCMSDLPWNWIPRPFMRRHAFPRSHQAMLNEKWHQQTEDSDIRNFSKYFSLHHRVQNSSGAHPASYPMGTRSSFLRDKVAETWSWPLTSI
jgi:hypothetical protein